MCACLTARVCVRVWPCVTSREGASMFGMFPTKPVDPPIRHRLMQAIVCVSEPTCLLRCAHTVYNHTKTCSHLFYIFFFYAAHGVICNSTGTTSAPPVWPSGKALGW